MSLLTACCDRSTWKRLSFAAANAAKAKLRGFGALPVHQDWSHRAAICETCPMRIVRRGVSYCGRPLLEQPVRDLAMDGCGCPTIAKAKSPGEHCPLTVRNQLVDLEAATCECKWCHRRSDLPPTASSS
jgi:hypothetical protein